MLTCGMCTSHVRATWRCVRHRKARALYLGRNPSPYSMNRLSPGSGSRSDPTKHHLCCCFFEPATLPVCFTLPCSFVLLLTGARSRGKLPSIQPARMSIWPAGGGPPYCSAGSLPQFYSHAVCFSSTPDGAEASYECHRRS